MFKVNKDRVLFLFLLLLFKEKLLQGEQMEWVPAWRQEDHLRG